LIDGILRVARPSELPVETQSNSS